jgi:hypothetical protein
VKNMATENNVKTVRTVLGAWADTVWGWWWCREDPNSERAEKIWEVPVEKKDVLRSAVETSNRLIRNRAEGAEKEQFAFFSQALLQVCVASSKLARGEPLGEEEQEEGVDSYDTAIILGWAKLVSEGRYRELISDMGEAEMKKVEEMRPEDFRREREMGINLAMRTAFYIVEATGGNATIIGS